MMKTEQRGPHALVLAADERRVLILRFEMRGDAPATLRTLAAAHDLTAGDRADLPARREAAHAAPTPPAVPRLAAKAAQLLATLADAEPVAPLLVVASPAALSVLRAALPDRLAARVAAADDPVASPLAAAGRARCG